MGLFALVERLIIKECVVVEVFGASTNENAKTRQDNFAYATAEGILALPGPLEVVCVNGIFLP